MTEYTPRPYRFAMGFMAALSIAAMQSPSPYLRALVTHLECRIASEGDA